MTIIDRIFEAFEQQNLLKTYLLTLLLTMLFLYLFSWPGCILAALIGGFFTRGYSRAAIIGFFAGLTTWGILVGIHAAFGGIVVLDLFGALAGLEGMGTVLALVIVFIGGVLGLAGSLFGNAINSLLEPFFAENSEPATQS